MYLLGGKTRQYPLGGNTFSTTYKQEWTGPSTAEARAWADSDEAIILGQIRVLAKRIVEGISPHKELWSFKLQGASLMGGNDYLKAGIDGFALGLADHLHGSGVDVIVVRPGFVHTRMTAGLKAPPLSTDAPTVARAIVTALRTRRAVVWVPSQLRWLMVVLRHLPRAVFRRLPI